MKFKRISLPAFGHFTDSNIEFSQSDNPNDVGGLHLIFGQNEAGKSTLLDAIKYALYGMPTKAKKGVSLYDFKHAKNRVKIIIELLLDNGDELRFLRNRARTISVCDPETEKGDSELAARLESVLQGIPQSLWITRHGLNQEALRSGSAELLSGEATADALVGHISGVNLARQVLKKLEEEQTELLMKGGKSAAINKAVHDLKNHGDTLRAAKRSFQEYEQLIQQKSTKSIELRKLRAKRSNLKDSLSALERISRAQYILNQRAELLDETQSDISVPALWSKEIDARYKQAMQAVVTEQGHLEAARVVHTKTITELEKNRADKQLLKIADTVTALNSETSLVQKVLGDIQELQQDKLRREQQLGQTLETVPNSDVTLVEYEGLVRSFEKQQAILKELSAAEQELKKAQAEHAAAAIAAKTDDSLDQKLLQLATVLAQVHSFDEKALLAETERIADLKLELDNQAKRNGFNDAQQVNAAQLPSRVLIEQLLDGQAQQTQALNSLQSEIASLKDNISDKRIELEAIEAKIGKDTLNELKRIRTERNDLWESIGAAATGKTEPVSETIVSSFEALLEDGDQRADQLMKQAEVLGGIAERETSIKRDSERLKRLESTREEITGRLTEIEDEWNRVWAPSGIRAPQMVDALRIVSELEAITDQLAAMTVDEQKNRVRTKDLAQVKAELMRVLVHTSNAQSQSNDEQSSLSFLTEQAKQIHQKLEDQRDSARRLQGALDTQTRILEQKQLVVDRCVSAVEDHSAIWQQTLRLFRLDESVELDYLEQLLGRYEQRFSLADQLAETVQQLGQHEQFISTFKQRVKDAVGEVDSDVVSQVNELFSRCNEALQMQAKCEELSRQRSEIETQIVKHEAQLSQAESELSELQKLVNGHSLDELATHSANWEEAQNRKQKLDGLEAQFADQTGLSSRQAAEIIAQRNGLEIAEEIAKKHEDHNAITLELEELEDEVEQIDQRIGALTKELDHSDVRAAYQDAQVALTKAIPRYRLITAQIQLLRQEISAALEAQRGPFINYASEFMRQLTNGEWVRILTGYDDLDQSEAQVENRSGEAVAIPNLSEGTRDQLYLALRLAMLMDASEHNERMPFIVDDILMTFDDERAEAALRLLGELGEKMQIIFLTHHQHLVDIAEKVLSEKHLKVHNLSRKAIEISAN